jgi:uncharacterized protein
VLPILSRGRLVGRLDAKAHRADGLFEVKALYLEQKIRATDELVADIARAITRCAAWHRLPRARVTRTGPAALRRRLTAALS